MNQDFRDQPSRDLICAAVLLVIGVVVVVAIIEAVMALTLR